MIRNTLPLCVALAAPAFADDPGEEWSRFRGPDGAGVAADDAPLPEVLDLERNLLWKRELPPGLSSPCVSGDRVFVTGATEEELVTLCIDRASGEIAWRRSLPAAPIEHVHEINGPASPTPTADAERVIVSFPALGLVGYDREGKELWRRPLPAPNNTFGPAASPILARGRLVLLHDAEEGSFLESIDPASGATQWRTERLGFKSGWSTPGLWKRGDTDELLVYGIGWLTAYDLAGGEERWSVPGLADEPIVTPVTGDGLVFVSSYNMRTSPEVQGLPQWSELVERYDHDGDGTLDREEADENASILSRYDADGEGDHPLRMFFNWLDVDRDGELTELEWAKVVRWVEGFAQANALVAIRPGERETEIAWQHARGVPEAPSPLCYRGRVYLVKNGGLVTCLAAQDGRILYEERLDSRGPCYASPVAGDGKVYAASARGRVVVFAAGDELRVLSRNDLGERIMATPALAGGRVYVRGERALFAFGPEPEAEGR